MRKNIKHLFGTVRFGNGATYGCLVPFVLYAGRQRYKVPYVYYQFSVTLGNFTKFILERLTKFYANNARKFSS